MPKAPWDILGPAVPSQTQEAIKTRYVNSFKVAGLLFIGLTVFGVVVGELAPYLTGAANMLDSLFIKMGWPLWMAGLTKLIIPCSIVLGLIHALPAVLVWIEQKIAAHIQLRLGPMKVGGWHGWAQTIADGVKGMLKQDIVPDGADKWVHFLAPIIVTVPAYMCYAPLPFGDGLVATDLDVGLLFILGFSGLSVIGLLMAGWASNSKYSVLGGLRAAAQMVSYEIPRVVSVIPVVMWVGSLKLTEISSAQSAMWGGGMFPKWFIFYPIVGQISFLIYLITSIAETNRVPFDLAEAESELTSGVYTEYSGMKYALFFLAEYAHIFLACGLGAVLFLGGGSAPFPFLDFIPSHMWFFGKSFLLVFIFVWVRWTFPRIRVDRLMEFCWKFLLPWSLVNVALAGFLILWKS